MTSKHKVNTAISSIHPKLITKICDGTGFPKSFTKAFYIQKLAAAKRPRIQSVSSEKLVEVRPSLKFRKNCPIQMVLPSNIIGRRRKRFLVIRKVLLTLQNEVFNAGMIYAPFSGHKNRKCINNLFFSANKNLILEGCDISKAFLYGELNVQIVMKKLTDSSQKHA